MNDLRAVIRQATRAGLSYEHGGKHPRIVDPSTGKFVTVSNTPRCPHAHKRIARDVRRYLGVVLT